MARVQAGDTDAFAQLYNRHAVAALRVACAVCHDAACAEEAVQDGFLSIWRNRASYRPEAGSLQAWLMRMVQNRAIDSVRDAAARRRREQLDALSATRSAPVAPSSQDEAITRWERGVLRSSLGRLPESQAQVIVLAYFGGLSQIEIAAQLGVPKSTIKGRMRLGLEKLRKEMAIAELEIAVRQEPQTAACSSDRPSEAWLENCMAPSSIGP